MNGQMKTHATLNNARRLSPIGAYQKHHERCFEGLQSKLLCKKLYGWKSNRWTVLSYVVCCAKLRTHQERVRHMPQQSTAAAARAPPGTASCGCQKQRQTSHLISL
jgi:hypothetical protein